MLTKAAKVESWLNGGTSLMAGDGTHGEGEEENRGGPTDAYGVLNAHFADLAACGGGRRAGGHGTVATEEELDAKSVASSSHTSGIVTDFPVSPKLSPALPCRSCDTSGFVSSPPPTVEEVGVVKGPDVTTTTAVAAKCSNDHASSGPALCQRGRHSPAISLLSVADTVIDEPVVFTPMASPRLERWSPVRARRVKEEEEEEEEKDGKRGAAVKQGVGSRKGPAAPENVGVVAKCPGFLRVTWTPVK